MSTPVLMHGFRVPAPAAVTAVTRLALPVRLPGGALSVLLLAALGVFGALHVMNPMTFPIRHVEINGEFAQLSPAALQRVAENVVRGGFFNVNVETVRRALLNEPWVREVTVRRVWPQSLSLHVQEQEAAARWGAGGLLNADGELFGPDPATFPADLPVLAGPGGTEQLVLERFRFVEQMLAEQGLKVAALALSERRAWTMTMATGQQVILGRTQFVQRARRFAAAVQQELAGKLDAVRVADMRYTNGFAVQWRERAAAAAETGNNGQAN